MKSGLLYAAFLLKLTNCCAQFPTDSSVASFLSVQKTWVNLSCAVIRTDTLVTDDTRKFSGVVVVERDSADPSLGFRFNAHLNGDSVSTVYDGHAGYEVSDVSGQFRMNRNPVEELLYNGAGRLVPRDILVLDTADVASAGTRRDGDTMKIILKLRDISLYHVTNRYKEIGWTLASRLPVSFRYHQETLGKIQDLHYALSAVSNDTVRKILPILSATGPGQAASPAHRIFKLAPGISGTAPSFTVPAIDGGNVSLSDFRGRLILLDFWEVWCGPCMEAAPRVEKLEKKYGAKGLIVLGITSDKRSLSAVRALFTTSDKQIVQLIGDDNLKAKYHVQAIPHYVLISRKGKIIFSRAGFSESFDEVIMKSLR